MSRIGKSPIPVPAGVEVTTSGAVGRVKGSKGSMEHRMPAGISMSIADGVLTVERENDDRPTKALHGLSRSLVNNMVVGVSEGFRKDLEIVVEFMEALELAVFVVLQCHWH